MSTLEGLIYYTLGSFIAISVGIGDFSGSFSWRGIEAEPLRVIN
jgi:hypothetical protein